MCTPKKGLATSTAVMIRQEVPFEREVLKFLLEHRDEIRNPVVRDFVCSYVDWLYQCTNQQVERLTMGRSRLLRVEAEDGASYGYDPAQLSYWLSKLNQLFFLVMGLAYLRATRQENEELPLVNQQLSFELLAGLSGPLGFYALVHYFQGAPDAGDKAWLDRACDVFGDLRDLEAWRPRKELSNTEQVQRVLSSPESDDEPYYLRGFLNCTRKVKPARVLEAERKRLVEFLKKLRLTLDVLNDDPMMVNSAWQEIRPEQEPTDEHDPW